MEKPPIIKELTLKEKIDNPVLFAIAGCEGGTQFHKDGSLVRGIINPNDVGVMQINEKYHLVTAKKLGMDIYTENGNITYSKYLYDRNGTADWLNSQYCWGPKLVAQGLSYSGRPSGTGRVPKLPIVNAPNQPVIRPNDALNSSLNSVGDIVPSLGTSSLPENLLKGLTS